MNKPNKDLVAWECPTCGHRQWWRWGRGEAAFRAPITMVCDKCKAGHKTLLVQIGRNAWAAIFK